MEERKLIENMIQRFHQYLIREKKVRLLWKNIYGMHVLFVFLQKNNGFSGMAGLQSKMSETAEKNLQCGRKGTNKSRVSEAAGGGKGKPTIAACNGNNLRNRHPGVGTPFLHSRSCTRGCSCIANRFIFFVLFLLERYFSQRQLDFERYVCYDFFIKIRTCTYAKQMFSDII